MDQIWADEPGLMIRFERFQQAATRNVGVRITIVDTTQGDKELAQATLAGWRWERAVKAMEETSEKD